MNRQKKMYQILDKVIDVGWDGLSEEDKDYLQEQSGNYHDTKNPN